MENSKKKKIHQHTKHSYARKAKSDTQSHRVPHWFTIVWNRIWAACQLKRSFGYGEETPRPLRVLTRDWGGQKRVKSSSQLNELTHVLLSPCFSFSLSLTRTSTPPISNHASSSFDQPAFFLSFTFPPPVVLRHSPTTTVFSFTLLPSEFLPISGHLRPFLDSVPFFFSLPFFVKKFLSKHTSNYFHWIVDFDENFWMKITPYRRISRSFLSIFTYISIYQIRCIEFISYRRCLMLSRFLIDF